MSRIGKKPVQIPAGVEVAVDGTHVSVKGSKGTLEADFYEKLTIEVADGVLTVSRPDDERETRARHGLTRALIQNMVIGVSEGYTKVLELARRWLPCSAQGQGPGSVPGLLSPGDLHRP